MTHKVMVTLSDRNDIGCEIGGFSIPIPKNENKRLKILKEARIFDTNTFEESYDRYTAMASRLFQVPIALISLIDTDRQWFKSRFGLKAKETPRTVAFCTYAILEESPTVLIVPDALQDPRFAQNPLVLGPPFIRFYAGASLVVDEIKVGTLCIIDRVPRSLDQFKPKEMAILEDLAKIVSNLIKQRREDHLQNIYETLIMNADTMKLLQAPLNNLQKSKEKIQRLYSSMKGICMLVKQSQRDHQRLIVQELFNEIQYFTMKTKSLLEISSYLTQLVIEIHHLERQTEYIMNDHQSAVKGVKAKEETEIGEKLPSAAVTVEGHVEFQSLKKMNVQKLQHDFRKYHYQIKNDEEGQSVISIDWKLDNLFEPTHASCTTDQNHAHTLPTTLVKVGKCSFPKFLYSYPTLIQLILMILVDSFDHHHHLSYSENQLITITMESIKTNTNYDEKKKYVKASGYWLIKVASRLSSPPSMKSFIDIFHILNRIRNCRHYLSSDVKNGKKCENATYSIEIPFYDIQLNTTMDAVLVDTSAKTAVSGYSDYDQSFPLLQRRKKFQGLFHNIAQQLYRLFSKQHVKILPGPFSLDT